jgi:Domain of unknown function (DUF1707)
VPANPQLRASDADRDRVVAQLREHYAAGRLDAEEGPERIGQALDARTLGELAELTADLPDLHQSPGAPSPRVAPGWASSPRPLETVGPGGHPARLTRSTVGITGLGVVAAAYLVTGLATGIWWIPRFWIVMPAIFVIRARIRCGGGSHAHSGA